MRPGSMVAKRGLDVFSSLLGLVLLSPLFLLIALAILLDSGRPVLYRQTRIGRGGRSFHVIKFRTMVVGADGISRLTTSGDPRITRIGNLLRRSNLDELPQLWNVLRGDMSLVGPRPEVAEFVDMADPRWQEVLSVRPGMTAPVTIEYRDEAAVLSRFADPVKAYRDEVLPRKLELSAQYVRTAGFRRDIATILATFVDIATRRRANEGHRILGVRVTHARRYVFFVVVDAALLAASALGAAWVAGLEWTAPVAAFALAWSVVGVAMLSLAGGHRIAWSYVGLRDLGRVVLAVAGATFALASAEAVATALVPTWSVPWRVAIIAAPFAFCAVSAFRLAKRAHLTALGATTKARHPRTVLIGAGQAGVQVLMSIQAGEAPYHVIGFLDDDPLSWRTRIHGVNVMGPVSQLRSVCQREGVDAVIICVAAATSEWVQRIVHEARVAGVDATRIVPPITELLDGKVTIAATREVSLEDLLGREVIEIDRGELDLLLAGRRVLVTGGAGTIGAELCRQIAHYRPSELTVLDIDESRLHDAVLRLRRENGNITVHAALVDVRDRLHVRDTFGARRPEIVFHAAAYKHVPLMEENPVAALAANVIGTANVLGEAEDVHVDRFILISTDKAVEPSSVMGASKRLAELLLAEAGSKPMIRACVRFGNVIGSRGSVIPTFEDQLRAGGPLTVTHPEMVRYFMMTSEAVALVLHAASQAEARETFVLDMGKPVRIADVAREFVRLHGLEPDRDVRIVFTGLRPGEKLFEVLTYPDEATRPTRHPRVLRVMATGERIAGLVEHVQELVSRRDDEDARRWLRKLFPSLEIYEAVARDLLAKP